MFVEKAFCAACLLTTIMGGLPEYLVQGDRVLVVIFMIDISYLVHLACVRISPFSRLLLCCKCVHFVCSFPHALVGLSTSLGILSAAAVIMSLQNLLDSLLFFSSFGFVSRSIVAGSYGVLIHF